MSKLTGAARSVLTDINVQGAARSPWGQKARGGGGALVGRLVRLFAQVAVSNSMSKLQDRVRGSGSAAGPIVCTISYFVLYVCRAHECTITVLILCMLVGAIVFGLLYMLGGAIVFMQRIMHLVRWISINHYGAQCTSYNSYGAYAPHRSILAHVRTSTVFARRTSWLMDGFFIGMGLFAAEPPEEVP